MDLVKDITDLIEGYLKSQTYSNALMVAKACAVMFIVIEFLGRYFGEGIDDKERMAFRWSDLTRPFLYVFFICSFNSILGYFDAIIEDFFKPVEEGKTIYKDLFKEGAKAVDRVEEVKMEGMDVARYLKNLIMNYVNFGLAYFLGAIDLAIYASFLAERYFLLGVANLLFPFLLAFSALRKFQDYIVKGLKAYFAVVIMLYIIYIGENVGTKIFELIYNRLVDKEELGIEEGNIMTFFYIIIAAVIGLATKLKLIKSGISYVFRVVA